MPTRSPTSPAEALQTSTGGEIARLRWSRAGRPAGDRLMAAVGTWHAAAAKMSTATNFSHWASGAAGCDRPTSVLGQLMNRCVTSPIRPENVRITIKRRVHRPP